MRNRAINILASVVKWDEENRFNNVISDFLKHITDEKPISARQCIKALTKIGLAKAQYIPRTIYNLEKSDISQYNDSMRALIKNDILKSKESLIQYHNKLLEVTNYWVPNKCDFFLLSVFIKLYINMIKY